MRWTPRLASSRHILSSAATSYWPSCRCAPDEHGYHDVTDVDVIAVRFPHEPHALSRWAARPLDVLLGADPELGSLEDGLDVLVGEVKESEARLNPALRRRETLAFALRRAGCCPE